MTGPIGIFKASLAGLADEIRWPLPKYTKAFREGLAKGFWKHDERFHVILFPKFFKHNKPENPNVLKAWMKYYDEVPNCILKAESIQSLKDFAKGWGNPFESLCQTLGVTFPKQEQEQEQEQEQDTPQTPQGDNGHVERFNDFWKAYPKKIGKGEAQKAWGKYKPSTELLAIMIAAISKAQRSLQWQKEGGQFIPNPATWLNQKRWEDEPLLSQSHPRTVVL
jgi:hypothetical protein